jgi:pimeloyl-ACP methyl ester carboxylesterase
MHLLNRTGRSRRRPAAIAAVAAAALLALLVAIVPAGATSAARAAAVPKPTIVLVHGAFADASGWDAVISRLEHDGYPVVAPAVPLRGVASDASYLSSVLKTISGPIVLVGHSYGGAVITNVAPDPNIKALVYIAAFAPAEGESAIDIVSHFPGSLLATDTTGLPFPEADGSTGVDVYIKTADFRDVFAADVPAPLAAEMAATQRPVTQAALLEKSGTPEWKTVPSWFLVARNDQAIPAAAELFMATRAGSHIVEISSSHAAMISHPSAVTSLILSAATGAS